jgi:hypothetical protein
MVGTVKNRYNLSDYVYNSGDITSKTNKTTNPYIKFYLIDPTNDSFKINVMIYKRGAVQLRGSHNTKTKDTPLEMDILKKVYLFLKQLFQNITEEFITDDPNIPIPKKINNMIDGTQPEMCHDRKGREVRPVPYSFYGKCPMPGYIVKPYGVKNSKGKVVKVNFGFGGSSAKGKRMNIKVNNPKRRAAYRARHNCDNPGPRDKANYWSCKKW